MPLADPRSAGSGADSLARVSYATPGGQVSRPALAAILPVTTYVRYAKALGVAPSTPEHKKLSELPQFFADMNGWEELARDVSAVYREIPASEQTTTVALVGNYGEAGALELYAAKFPLPRVISSHNSSGSSSRASGASPSRRTGPRPSTSNRRGYP